ncbi:hypothetical protein KBX37_16845 [Micromonospora sp. U56]|uniref:hypothetical protein n=1 Tax=Micromonospora sp. U56 TaxID=2824900 RepID=UPI001B382F74|nr:hypothetical protein [Micromonospora sp. U56]MBQ0894747.1 hypothetical protein [Micromonospora sp. U56]
MFPVLTSSHATGVGPVEEHAGEAFQFLADDDGCIAMVHRERDRSVLAYVLPQVFVEVELDWEERAAFLLVGEPADGGRPAGYYVDPQGRKVRWHLTAALDRSPDPEHRGMAKRLRQVTRRSGFDAMVAQVDGYADAIREVLPQLPALVRELRS